MKTLYLRIVLTTIAVMVFSSLLAFIVANVYYQYSLKPYNDQKLTRMAKDIASFYESNRGVDQQSYLQHISKLGYQIYVVDSTGHETFYGREFRNQRLEKSAVKQVLEGKMYHGIANFPSQVFVTGFFDNVLANTIGVPLKGEGNKQQALFIRPDIQLQFGEMRIFFSVILLLMIVLSILFVLISTRYLVKPIVKLTEATKQVAKGKYNVELYVKRRDEIGALASHFSEMAKSLEQLEEMRQEFVSNVSHEIQSPLASIQGFSKTLRSADLSDEQRNEYLSIIEEESRRMSSLSKQLLTLASLDKESEHIEKSTFDVATQIKQVLFMTEWSWREKELAIEMDLPSTMISGDQKLLHQVWTNLITNSVKFTEEGGTLSLRVGMEDTYCHVEFQDTGIGMSKESLPHIFNRFYKEDKARSRTEGSSGLGLAIVKQIVDMHGGSIHVESEKGKGSTFHVYLPKM
ncbi:HAMP domain-containing histidine kinase [Priestia aryabhattai]|uniref:sensor histidine kinase n=1 Tax=Priestia TaxID=2800373 RepID=UPI000532B64C|nr:MULTISPECIES: HAMP domain-containing sensor histidine kinase [Priestia]MBY0074428.1 HAMP domain-containing protein [Priestia aryabhattai]MCM2975503.1 HAMP domain-containing histidine kinase [Priestia aryabhattai]MED3957813.1 HAMP domain-containing sensor histidine kinase [Priestia aryabhattai]MED3988272.1 HAMP domain-containing sensor histidine kinase [Priestia aryabhattai]PHF66258.1 two-component sensor histidine kinase [Priestia aryabhattai]